MRFSTALLQISELEKLLLSYIDQEKKIHEHIIALGTARADLRAHRFAFEEIHLGSPATSTVKSKNKRQTKRPAAVVAASDDSEKDLEDADADAAGATIMRVPVDPQFDSLFDTALKRAEVASDANFAKKHPKLLEFRYTLFCRQFSRSS